MRNRLTSNIAYVKRFRKNLIPARNQVAILLFSENTAMMIKTKIVPVVLASDDSYAPYMYVAIYSMLVNKNAETKYEFYLLVTSAFSANHTSRITELEKKYDCRVRFIDMQNAFHDIKMSTSHLAPPAYFRLLIADRLPQYQKCIYLDTDIIVTQDLSDMYSTDLGDNYLGGVLAPAYNYRYSSIFHSIRLGAPLNKGYINSGVVLFNLEKIRQDNLIPKFMKLAQKRLSSEDQDVLNIACLKKIFHFPLKYNLMTKYWNQWGKIADHNIFFQMDIDEAIKDPVIIHYADIKKPWNDKNIWYADQWWRYAAMTPYYNEFKNHLSCKYKIIV